MALIIIHRHVMSSLVDRHSIVTVVKSSPSPQNDYGLRTYYTYLSTCEFWFHENIKFSIPIPASRWRIDTMILIHKKLFSIKKRFKNFMNQ